MNVTVLTPDKELYKGTAISVKVPGSDGQFEVLNNHAPIVSSLQAGEVRILTGTEKVTFRIQSGFIEVLRNEVAVLVQGVVEA